MPKKRLIAQIEIHCSLDYLPRQIHYRLLCEKLTPVHARTLPYRLSLSLFLSDNMRGTRKLTESRVYQ